MPMACFFHVRRVLHLFSESCSFRKGSGCFNLEHLFLICGIKWLLIHKNTLIAGPFILMSFCGSVCLSRRGVSKQIVWSNGVYRAQSSLFCHRCTHLLDSLCMLLCQNQWTTPVAVPLSVKAQVLLAVIPLLLSPSCRGNPKIPVVVCFPPSTLPFPGIITELLLLLCFGLLWHPHCPG